MMNPESPHYTRDLNGSYTTIKKLTPRHHQIIDLHLQGLSYKAIGLTLDMSYRQVANVLNTPLCQHAVALRRSNIENQVDESIIQHQDEVQEFLKQQTLSAAMKLGELIDSDNDSVARQAANDILDRGGHPKVTRQESDVKQTLVLDADQSSTIEQALLELSESTDSPKT